MGRYEKDRDTAARLLVQIADDLWNDGVEKRDLGFSKKGESLLDLSGIYVRLSSIVLHPYDIEALNDLSRIMKRANV